MREPIASFARLLGAVSEEELRLVRNAGRSLTEYYVLRALGAVPGTTVTQLAARLSLAKSSVSFVVDVLVKGGLVLRSPEATDRRRIGLHLSSRGTAWMHRFWKAKAALLMESMTGLTADERRVANQLMVRVAETLERRLGNRGTRPAAASPGRSSGRAAFPASSRIARKRR